MGRKNKVVVSFNDKDRRDYLTGFRKRKDQRRKVAKQKLEKRIDEERKALREARRKSGGMTRAPIPQDVEDLESRVQQEVVDLPTHSVTVTQLENLDLSQKDLFLGFNHGGTIVKLDETEPAHEEGESSKKSAKNRSSRQKSSAKSHKGEETDPKKLKAHERMLAKLSGKNRPRNLRDKDQSGGGRKRKKR
ncbi:hypothetical protein RvY_14036 [Ramazzottius varieornatus]|uniref:Nucleolar protein 12 n=1 Tax=Ramazzottius varieornatus TaxID=947166 RepID=A0A1D1VRN6_RAMVA|nr:hypothetical protein RvY_14036 [Ramazzottius varieornatus]